MPTEFQWGNLLKNRYFEDQGDKRVNIKLDLRDTDEREVCGTGSGLCPIVCFGISKTTDLYSPAKEYTHFICLYY
jgi:hypothetical protein